MKAYLFPGQGAQTLSMAQDIVSAFPAAKEIYDQAYKIIGIDLLNLTQEQLDQTRYTQLAIVMHSITSLEKERSTLTNKSSDQIALAGFSLGEYTALYAAGVIALEALLHLVNQRAILMQNAAEKNPGTMYAILGLADEQVETCLSTIPGVYPVNYNCPGQLVIAGSLEATEKASIQLLEIGAKRAMRLAVGGAFHSPYMEEAADALKDYAKQISFEKPVCPLYSNVTGQRLAEDTDFAEYLQLHMISPVRFTKEIQQMRLDGYDEFLELGPGRVLSGFMKKI